LTKRLYSDLGKIHGPANTCWDSSTTFWTSPVESGKMTLYLEDSTSPETSLSEVAATVQRSSQRTGTGWRWIARQDLARMQRT